MNSLFSTQIPVPVSQAPLWGWLLNNKVCAGFPSPAEDLGAQRIDLTQLLVTHPAATYFLRASGISMIEFGIFDGDLMLVNRALRPRHGQMVVAIMDGEFVVKKLYRRAGRTRLQAGNPTYPDLVPQEGQTLEIWGVVTATIKQFPV
jgi:DNA polymerase V